MADKTYILVTGANAGLGLAICERLIDEFLTRRTGTLVLIPTTRTTAKADATVSRLRHHAPDSDGRIQIEPELFDLCNLISVQKACARLCEKYDRIDVAILNAGIGGWTGIDWIQAAKQLFTRGLTDMLTLPKFKLAEVGGTAALQLPARNAEDPAVGDAREEPGLGNVFTANVFGHYLLVHGLMPLLLRPRGTEASRVIWLSSFEAVGSAFSLEDLQAMRSTTAYESNKRLTDILSLTASSPASRPYTTSFFSSTTPPNAPGHLNRVETPSTRKATLRSSTRSASLSPARKASECTPPVMYTAHPGMCQTDIMPLPPLLRPLLVLVWSALFYVVRWLGSEWHHSLSYNGATSMTWLALASKEELDARAGGDASTFKWGSATNWRGNERVKKTKVDWLYDEKGLPASEEARQEFFATGRDVWKEVEALREEWERRLAPYGEI